MKKIFIVSFIAVSSLLFCSCVYLAQEKGRIKYELPEVIDSNSVVTHLAYTLSY